MKRDIQFAQRIHGEKNDFCNKKFFVDENDCLFNASLLKSE
jgi:hypothetical protein